MFCRRSSCSFALFKLQTITEGDVIGETEMLTFLPKPGWSLLSNEDPSTRAHSPHPQPPLQRACTFQSSLSVFLFYRVHVGDQEEASSFVTLLCYRINFSLAHSIRFNTISVKEGQSSPLDDRVKRSVSWENWWSEKCCIMLPRAPAM